ncbi:hypothetical protein NSA24_02955 [Clostridioides mangenotii]|uniref:hypothetical protein n=1 Tax=Metaclostridioides mangenotii TaxID=1540 RepID=UPI00214A37EF|nr:hypothetical protein [Clostridioides mangenotii]MCR1953793.1 hypothetical protein [Clostridioides mangenotii]
MAENEKVETKKKITKVEIDIDKFTKEQLINSKKYLKKKYIIKVLLDDGKSYSFNEVDQILQQFYKKEVK